MLLVLGQPVKSVTVNSSIWWNSELFTVHLPRYAWKLWTYIREDLIGDDGMCCLCANPQFHSTSLKPSSRIQLPKCSAGLWHKFGEILVHYPIKIKIEPGTEYPDIDLQLFKVWGIRFNHDHINAKLVSAKINPDENTSGMHSRTYEISAWCPGYLQLLPEDQVRIAAVDGWQQEL